MNNSNRKNASGISPQSIPSGFPKLREAAMKQLRSPVAKKDCIIPSGLATIQFGTTEVSVPQDHQGAPNSTTATTATTIHDNSATSSIPLSVTSPAWLEFFPQNVAVSLPRVALPRPGSRRSSMTQFGLCNQLLPTQLSPSKLTLRLDSSQQASVNALQDKEQSRTLLLSIRVVEESVAGSLKTSKDIAEIVLPGPFLNQEYHCKSLDCFIADFEDVKLLNIDLLQGLVQHVQCEKPDYIQPQDLVRMLVALRTQLQGTHQQTTKNPYYLTLALPHLQDVMVEGKVQDLSRDLDHEPLFALLGQLMESSDPLLMQGVSNVLHVPNDETFQQFVLLHTEKIAMGLLGVASKCNLNLNGFSNGTGKLCNATVSTFEIGGKVIGRVQSVHGNGEGKVTSVKGGIISDGRLLWYTYLRKAREHIQNGQLADFNRLIFEAPWSGDVEVRLSVYQLLGENAVDSQWETITTRLHATNFLAELNRSDTILSHNRKINSWTLLTIRQIIGSPAISGYTKLPLQLQDLEKEGDDSKQRLYRNLMSGPIDSYPLQFHPPAPKLLALLDRIQAVPNIDLDINRLRSQQLQEYNGALYIPLQAKLTFQSDDDTLFPLMDKALEFLSSHRQVMLLLGDSGAGKSTFNSKLEHTLWTSYKPNGPIPLYCNLPTIDDPSNDLIAKVLKYHNFSDEQIQEMKLHRQFIAICDGYDESQLDINLHTTNGFNRPGQWNVKVVISCRSQYLDSDYHSRFQPQPTNQYPLAIPDLMMESVIAPFSGSQIEHYIEQYVSNFPVHHVIIQDRQTWTKREYIDKLIEIPKLMELVSNPFLLTLSLEALPEIVGSKKDLSAIKITRIQLYDGFVTRWLDENRLRLEDSDLSYDERRAFDLLLEDEDGFIFHGIQFQKNLASAIFKEQAGQLMISYNHLRDNKTWKSSFFSPDTNTKLLRESSTITRSGDVFRFLHRSLLEYFYSRTVYDPVDYDLDAGQRLKADLKDTLSQRSIIKESVVLQFLAERVESDCSFEKQLLVVVEDSKSDEQASQAAANAISILVRAKVRFNGADLRGIRISGANICGGQFDSADMQGADLRDVNLTKTWLRQANFSKALMSGVQFGELPYLEIDAIVSACAFSFDGGLLAVSTIPNGIMVYDTSKWMKIAQYPGQRPITFSPTTRELARRHDHNIEICDIFTGKARLVLPGHSESLRHISYSPDGKMIATGTYVDTIQIWSTSSGDILCVLDGHFEVINGFAFSPCGLQLVSCSMDETVRTWDTQTGEPILILEGHSHPILSVAYSPDGRQIASADEDEGFALWDAQTGIFLRALVGHTLEVSCVVYSPDGHRLASCGHDGAVRLWDPLNGELFDTLSGHKDIVTSLSYSPSGEHIASGSADGTVRLWDVGQTLPREEANNSTNEWAWVDISSDGTWIAAGDRSGAVQLWETRTGKPGAILTGHEGDVNDVAFSPFGERVASAGQDRSVRLWCVRTGESINVLQGHTGVVYSVTFSSCGHQLASCSGDKTIRFWDTVTDKPGSILKGHTDVVCEVTFSPSGHQVASGSDDNTVRLWCTLTGEQLLVLQLKHSVHSLKYCPAGQELISVSLEDGVVRCWDTNSGECVDQLESKAYKIYCCSFSPCGKLMATIGNDGILRLWDQSSGNRSEIYTSYVGVFTNIKWGQGSDGMYLTTSQYGVLCVWEVKDRSSTYTLSLLWSLGVNELSLADANLIGAVGLSPVNLELVKQREARTGANTNPTDNINM